jgi:hypothetical protein
MCHLDFSGGGEGSLYLGYADIQLEIASHVNIRHMDWESVEPATSRIWQLRQH